MASEKDQGLGQSPENPVSGQVKPLRGPLERAGTEAERDAQGDRAPPKTGQTPAGQHNSAAPGEEAGRDTERAAAYRENDA